MNFFLDHDVPTDIGRVLRVKGHTVHFLQDVLPRATSDVEALRYAASQNLVVITCNRQDFLQLVESEPNPGLIILVRRQTRVAECAALLRLIESAGGAGIVGNINFA